MSAQTIEIPTPRGPARVHLDVPASARAALVLGHGAGGGVEAPDLVAAHDVALAEGFAVALTEQPYRVAGRRSPPRAEQLDEAWLAVIENLRGGALSNLPMVTGGRSMGARVACRTAKTTDCVAVLCLAFPLVPPARGTNEPVSRLPELDSVTVPVLVVQGDRDRFGMPPPGRNRRVITVPGDHGLKADLGAVGSTVSDWLVQLPVD